MGDELGDVTAGCSWCRITITCMPFDCVRISLGGNLNAFGARGRGADSLGQLLDCAFAMEAHKTIPNAQLPIPNHFRFPTPKTRFIGSLQFWEGYGGPRDCWA